ncbi:MAG: SLBB domain-containing protein [Acidobacteriota bacterium]
MNKGFLFCLHISCLAVIFSGLFVARVIQAQPAAPPASAPVQSPEQRELEGSQVLGKDTAVSEEDFVESIVPETEQLPIFGRDVFGIDTTTLVPGAINPQSFYVSPGDELLLQVWGDLNLEYQLQVSGDIYVSIPEVGRVYLGGKTLAEAQVSVVRALAGIYSSYIDPDNPSGSSARVSLTPVSVKDVRFLVQGEVTRPGSYSLHPSLANLVYAVSRAGGVRETGSLRNIAIRRGGRSVSVDFYDFLLQGNIGESSVQIQSGDIIFVPLKTKEVSIQGEVRRPARYELLEGEYLQDLIKMAGGLKPSASLEKSLILRTQLNEGMQTIDVNLNEMNKIGLRVSLQDQDIVNVFSTFLLRIDYVSVQGLGIALPGEYQLKEGMRLKDVIEQAGGLTGQAYLARADLIRTRPDMTRYYLSVNLRDVLRGAPDQNVLMDNLDQLIIYTVKEIEGQEWFVNLQGHVKNPGQFELYAGMTLFDLLFAKGGFQDQDFLKETYAERGDVLRVPSDGAGRQLIKFNLADLLAGKPDANLELQARDNIRIYSVSEVVAADHTVTLSGHVKQPGSHSLHENMTLFDVLEIKGGFQDREFRKQTFLERADLIRQVRNGNQIDRELVRFNLGALLLGDDSQNLKLEANDQIVIYSTDDFANPKTVSIDGFVKKPGSYPYAVNMTLGDLIVQAGGFREGAYARAEISRLDASANPSVEKQILQVDVTENFFESDEQSGLPLKNNDHVFIRKHPDYEEQAVVELTGEIQFPGRYVLKGDQERLSDLIRRAGGLKESAFMPAARLLRLEDRPETEKPWTEERGTPERYRITFQLEKALQQPGSGTDLFLRDGDRLEIPRFENLVRIRGQVLQELTLTHQPGKDAAYYIAQSGGLLDNADKNNITIILPDGRVLQDKRGFLGLGSTKIEPMSIIEVGATSLEL